MDFRYAPYALGDTFTWLTNLQIFAERNSLSSIDMMLVTLPKRPSSGLQPHISRHNYVQVIDGLLPAFQCCNGIRSISIYEQNRNVMQRVLQAMLARTPSWPSVTAHLREQLDFFSHKQINAFFAERGWIPKLCAPPGFRHETDQFKQRFFQGRIPFVINIRQRSLTNDPQGLNRDSSSEAWFGFIERAEKRWPNALFILVGGYSEWERRFARLRNIIIPRTLGLHLGHELTMLLGGTPFIGTSSGFAAAATFSDTPYVITHFEHRSAEYVGIPVGTERYPFATAQQWLSWDPESEVLLSDLFDRMWNIYSHAKDGIGDA